MEEKIYTITFMDGQTLGGLTMNGNNFVSTADIDDSIFDDINLMEVTFSDGEDEWTVSNMKLIHKTEYANGLTYFTIEPKTERDLRDEDIEAKIEYIAMMTEVDL